MDSIVALKKCQTYEQAKVDKAISQLLDDLGGLSTVITKGSKVVLKPNLLMRKKPDRATTTHPAVIEAVVKEVQRIGGQVTIAESPGGPYSTQLLKSVYQVCGVTDVADRTGAVLNFDTGSEVISYPEASILKRIEVIKPVLEADVVINISKLKTHQLTYFTGAVKNNFGVIPGTTKADYHLRLPKMNDFANMLIDICLFVKPQLSIMDGIVGMEGPGPSGGKPKDLGILLASQNPFALDMISAHIVGLDLNKIPTVVKGREREVCPRAIDEITIVGELLESCMGTKFEPAITRETLLGNRTPTFVTNFLTKHMTPKPIFDHSKCIGCEDCVKNCPPKVITMKNNKPIVDLQACIKCYCCQELCPVTAIEIKRMGPLSWLWKDKP